METGTMKKLLIQVGRAVMQLLMIMSSYYMLVDWFDVSGWFVWQLVLVSAGIGLIFMGLIEFHLHTLVQEVAKKKRGVK
jgi:cytochrome c oxidase subunit IV